MDRIHPIVRKTGGLVFSSSKEDGQSLANKAKHILAWSAALAIPVLFLGLLFVYPVGAIVWRGLTQDGTLDVASFLSTLTKPRTLRALGNTLLQAFLGTSVSVVLAIPGAYVLYRHTFPGCAFLRTLAGVPFVIPTIVVGTAFRALFSSGGPLGAFGLDQSLTAIVCAMVFFNYGLVVRMIGSVWERLDPRAEQAAAALGASPPRVAVTVTLPALAPAIGAAAAIVFLFCSTAFAVVLVLGGSGYATIEVEMWIQATQVYDLSAAAALTIIQLVFVAAVLGATALLQRGSPKSLNLAEAKQVTPRLRLGRGTGVTLWASVLITLATAFFIFLPIITMLIRSFRRRGEWTFDNYRALLSPSKNPLSVNVLDAAADSWRIAIDATIIAVAVGLLLAIILTRRPRSNAGQLLLQGFGGFVMVPLGVSAVIVGLGFLIALDHPPLDLRSSPLLIPLAQALVAVPIVLRTALPILRGINPRLKQVAATLGASPMRVLVTVEGPMIFRSIGMAIGFAFAISLGEFGATSFLARPDHPTLPILIYRLLGRPGEGNYETAMAASVVLALTVGLVMGLCEQLRPRKAGK